MLPVRFCELPGMGSLSKAQVNKARIASAGGQQCIKEYMGTLMTNCISFLERTLLQGKLLL